MKKGEYFFFFFCVGGAPLDSVIMHDLMVVFKIKRSNR